MDNVASQNTGTHTSLPPLNQLVGATALLKAVWPDERSRPSLRWLRQQQSIRAIPWTPAGRRVLFCPAHVLAFAGSRLTVLPQRWNWAKGGPIQLPAPDRLTDASGLIELLSREFGLKRSLRWARQQQKDRTVPYIKWGRKIFFAPAQVMATLRSRVD